MKVRVYLDTSVLSAYYDDRAPDRQIETEQFWARLSDFDVSTSDLAREELSQTPNAEQRNSLLQLLTKLTVFPVTDEMKNLAQQYIHRNVFTILMFNDALHVAAAVMNRQDVLLSWNFRHLVNRIRRAKVNEVNISLGLPTIEIIAPPEI